MLSLFFMAFALGLVFNAAPGAVFAETVREGVRGGFKPALAVQIGSLVGDAIWAILGLVGVGLFFKTKENKCTSLTISNNGKCLKNDAFRDAPNAL